MPGWRGREPTPVRLDRARLLDLDDALGSEWLIANGLGGYASGTVLCANTRRYHGLLVAALKPPAGRRVLLAKLDAELETEDGERIALSTNEYHDGTINPTGHLHLEEFWLDGTLPHWRWRFRDVQLERSIAMVHGQNTVVVRHRLLAADHPIRLRLTPFVTDRDHHQHTRGAHEWRWDAAERPGGAVVKGWPEATPLGIFGPTDAQWVETGLWYWSLLHRAERARGLDDLEDLYAPGLIVLELVPGASGFVTATTEPRLLAEGAEIDPCAQFEAELVRQRALVHSLPGSPSAEVCRLALAADQLVVRRSIDGPDGRTVIAGYHWFDDWGRDMAIALDGLCGATGRHDDTRAVLRTFARWLDRGMLPNRFPDDGASAEYHSVDAALWYVEAVARHLTRTQDWALVEELLPALDGIASGYHDGTHHGVGIDSADGLLRAGEHGLQLTWMDAKVGDWVVTPRRGKPVELQALWHNALEHLAEWQERALKPVRAAELRGWAERARAAFDARFWNEERGCCFDVVDADDLGGASDARVRPNQLFAVSLPHPILAEGRRAAVLAVAEKELLTPFGIRTLSPEDDGYVARYRGDTATRDGAYHQGIAWPWLLGAYVDAARRVHGASWDPATTLAGLLGRMDTFGLGTLPEIWDADPPYIPNGAISQAWSVAEVLRLLG